jgi:hypothetical protein
LLTAVCSHVIERKAARTPSAATIASTEAADERLYIRGKTALYCVGKMRREMIRRGLVRK